MLEVGLNSSDGKPERAEGAAVAAWEVPASELRLEVGQTLWG